MDKLSKHGSIKSRNCDNFDEDIFDDSSFLENLESNDFKDSTDRNKNNEEADFNISALCCDEELNGYDKLTGKTWIYPTNYPVRDYQFNIIKAAMLENCLVSLPTGLGKTFIAAVVMYNFYRWYPLGKIIFTAPTRPLVAQQIEACYNIVAMPPKDTIEMTGQMNVNTRKVHWKSKRVFFATPQVIYNDIKSGMCPGDKIRCLVFDEAHKARGNYAYGNIISTLSEMGHKIYRILALSATPGNKVEDVIHVVKRLNISHLELRTENCLDVKIYSHARKINTVVVELGPELSRLQQKYVEILDGYNRKLKNFNIVQNLGNLSKGRIVMLYKEFQGRERSARHPQHNNIMRTFTLLITLYHGLELLVKHGSRVFLNFFDEHPEKTWVHFDKDLTSFFDKLRDQLGINPLSFDRSIMPDGTIPEIPSNLNFGHPKFDKLKNIMLEHFNNAKQKGQVSKAIVFCEYRESVNLVHCLLLQCRPTIMPEMFVGHGSGKEGKAAVSQKQQLRVMRKFREGACNALVCTCVAEEGLDVGAVDLILCFDVSTRSPVRLVQRCGRTGRERSGQVFILVTEGKEHTTLLDCMRQNDGLNRRILQSEEVKKNLYKHNPRMLPRDFMPECQKMFITVKKEINEKSKKGKEKLKEKPKENTLKGQQDLRNMFLHKASSSKLPKRDNENNEWINKEEFNKIFPEGYRECNFFSQQSEYWAMDKGSLHKDVKPEPLIKLSSYLELQKNLQETYSIGHSLDTILLTELLQHKNELPIIKSPELLQKQEFQTNKSPAKKDGDIRVLFSKTTKSIKNYTKSMKELGISNNLNISTEVLNLLVDLSLENSALEKPCYICLSVCKCSTFSNSISDKPKQPVALCSRSQPVLPDINLINEINPETLLKLANDNQNIKMDCNERNNNIFSKSKLPTEGSSSSERMVEMLKKYVDTNTKHLKKIENHVFEEDCLFEENDVFDINNMPVNITSTVSEPQLSDIHSFKRFNEPSTSGLKNGITNNNAINTLQKSILNTTMTEKQEICDNDYLFYDKVLEDIDMTDKLTPIVCRPMYTSNDVHNINRIAESTVKDDKKINTNNNINIELHDENTMIFEDEKIDDVFDNFDMSDKLRSTVTGSKAVNTTNNTNIELDDDDTIILEDEEIGPNDNIFEDNDVFDDIDMPDKLTPPVCRPLYPSDDIHTISKIAKPTVTGSKTGNINNKTDIELDDDDIIIIESQEIDEKDKIFENNNVFEDAGTSSHVTPTTSRLPKNPSHDIHNTKIFYESSIQHNKTGNKNINHIKIENDNTLENSDVLEDIVQSDTTRTESRPLSDIDKRSLEQTNHETKTLYENNNDSFNLETDLDEDIFKDDDIFDDIQIQTIRTAAKSELQLNSVLITKRTSEPTQNDDNENDIYTISVLKYFRLNRISDIFQDSDVNNFKEEKMDNINVKNVSLLPQRRTNLNQQLNENNQTNTISINCPLSPSLLSGRSISDRSTSPILISQKRKPSLSINKPKKELTKSLSDNKRPSFVEENISMSSSTEPEHRKTMNSLQQDTDEIIVLDSDDDIFVDDPKKCKPQIETHENTTTKRKLQEEPTRGSDSPYFRKKPKFNEKCSKPATTIKEKIMAALTSHQNPGNSFNNNTQLNFMTTTSPTFKLKKENRDPQNSDESNKKSPKCKIDMLKRFRYETDNKSKVLHETAINVQKIISFNEDDDFKTQAPYRKKVLKLKKERKNAKKVSEFLDVEAELSQEGSQSSDERSDDSAGSLVHFICDDAPSDDIHDIYLQSVKSPVKGVFKVPQLPPLNKAEVFSQYVEEDTYEMDSFCVDSHMTLHETTEMSELEVAEMILKERRKEKNTRQQFNTQKDHETSPIIRKNNRYIRRQIDSDSEDSS